MIQQSIRTNKCLATAFVAVLTLLVDVGTGRAQSDFKVTLLGTGTPALSLTRFGPSTLVEAGNQKLLFDAGRGAALRLNQLGIPISHIDALFLTHFHSDHVNGIPDVWLTGWLPAGGQRKKPFRVIGPTGAKSLMSHLESAYADDVRIRIVDQRLPKSGAEADVTEFSGEGIVYDVGGAKVTALEVFHGELIKPAFGYRIDYSGRSVLISGDTKFSENVIKYGTGVDLLLHEVAAADPEAVARNPLTKLIFDHHTSPREAGEVFRRANPKLAAYTHIIIHQSSRLDELVPQTRQTYSGPLEVGEDLMSFDIGSTVTVSRNRLPSGNR